AAGDGDARRPVDRGPDAVPRHRQSSGASRPARFDREGHHRQARQETSDRLAARPRFLLQAAGHGLSRGARLPAQPVHAGHPHRGFEGGHQSLLREARARVQRQVGLAGSERAKELRAKALKGGTRYLSKLREQHKLTARERLDLLLDKDSFLEDGLLANVLAEELPADGVVTGLGTVEGRQVAVMANDPTVKAGSWGARTVEKIVRIQETAGRLRVPLFYLVDSAGARITDQIEMFPGRRHAGRIFFNQVQLSGRVPQVCLLFGPSAAGGPIAALVPAEAQRGYDMRKVIDALVDEGSWVEVKKLFARELLTGFARLDGRTVGILANQPMQKGGVLFVDSSDKAARFIWL